MFRKRRPACDDIAEAQKMREETAEEMREVQRQAPYVARLTARLIERRALNHFGDDIQITFSRRDK